jgi:hypothetical protein
MTVADKRPASRHVSRTAGRQVGMPAHRLRADRVAGRQADRPAGRRMSCRQALWQTVRRYGGAVRH